VLNFSSQDLTQVLQRASAGDPTAAARLLPMVYDELRELARLRMARTPPGNTLDPTALVHEAYLRIAGDTAVHWEGRKQFFFAASRAMRDILVEQARRKAAIKRGGAMKRVELDEAQLAFEPVAEDVITLDQAITQFEQEHPSRAETVILRYFAGMTIQEIADVLQVSTTTVERHWRFARAYLQRALKNDRIC